MKTNFNFSLKSLKVEGFEFKGDLGLSIKSEGDTSSITVKADVNKVTYNEATIDCDLHMQFDVETNTKESLVTFNAIHEVMLDPKASLMSSLKDLEERYQIDLNAIRTFYNDPETAIGNLVRYFEGDSDETPIDLDLEDDTTDDGSEPITYQLFINPWFNDEYTEVMGYNSVFKLPSNDEAIKDILWHVRYTLQGENVNGFGIKFQDGSMVNVEPRFVTEDGRDVTHCGERSRARNGARKVIDCFVCVNNGMLGDHEQYSHIELQ